MVSQEKTPITKLGPVGYKIICSTLNTRYDIVDLSWYIHSRDQTDTRPSAESPIIWTDIPGGDDCSLARTSHSSSGIRGASKVPLHGHVHFK